MNDPNRHPFHSPPQQHSGLATTSLPAYNAHHPAFQLSSQSPRNISLTLPVLSPSFLNVGSPDQALEVHGRSPSPSAFLLARPSDSNPPSRPHSRIQDLHGTSRTSTMNNHQRRASESSFYDYSDSDPFGDLIFQAPQPTSPPMSGNSALIDLTESSPPTMASDSRQTSRRSLQATDSTHKRQRSGTPKTATKRQRTDDKEIEQIDLVDVDNDEDYKNWEAEKKAKEAKERQLDEANKPIKLSEFQCIICLDNPTDLTVTWCGHLFCSQCLHEALHAGTQKKVCPICRQTISTSTVRGKRDGKEKPSAKGVFPLSMKLHTAKRKGKAVDR